MFERQQVGLVNMVKNPVIALLVHVVHVKHVKYLIFVAMSVDKQLLNMSLLA